MGIAARAAARVTAERSQPGDLIRYLRVPANAAAVVRKLAQGAQRGDVASARELRAWLDVVEADIPTSVSDLDAKTRHRLLARLLDELRQQDAPARPQEAP